MGLGIRENHGTNSFFLSFYDSDRTRCNRSLKSWVKFKEIIPKSTPDSDDFCQNLPRRLMVFFVNIEKEQRHHRISRDWEWDGMGYHCHRIRNPIQFVDANGFGWVWGTHFTTDDKLYQFGGGTHIGFICPMPVLAQQTQFNSNGVLILSNSICLYLSMFIDSLPFWFLPFDF